MQSAAPPRRRYAPRAAGPPRPAAGATSAAPSTSGTSSAPTTRARAPPGGPPTNPKFSRGGAARARLRSPDGGGGQQLRRRRRVVVAVVRVARAENDGRRRVNAQLELLSGKAIGEGRRGEIYLGRLDGTLDAVKAFKRGGASMSWSPGAAPPRRECRRAPPARLLRPPPLRGGRPARGARAAGTGRAARPPRRRAAPELRALAYFAQAAAGVAHCHLRGCVNGQLRLKHLLLHADAVKLLASARRRGTPRHARPRSAASASPRRAPPRAPPAPRRRRLQRGLSGGSPEKGPAALRALGGRRVGGEHARARRRRRRGSTRRWASCPKHRIAGVVVGEDRLRIGRPLDAPELAGRRRH